MRSKAGSADTAAGSKGDRLEVLWESLRTSFWLVPGSMALLAGVLAFLCHLADVALSRQNPATLPFLIFVSTPDTARQVTSTLLSSMITMTSLVFSITMVVLTLAASQFGPRLIRSFMANPHTQYVLGVFVMTSVYCLAVLGAIGRASAGDTQQPFVTVSVALLLTLVSVGLLVLFLHFLARSIVSETVIERVGREVDGQVDGFDPIPEERNDALDDDLPADYRDRARFFGSATDGYVEAIAFERLVEQAREADVLIALSFRPGDYVVIDGNGIGVYPADRCSEDLEEAIQHAIIVGPHRSPNQDPEFSIRHLVEIAVRALSPGINDPYTAAAVINRMSATLSRMMRRALPKGAMRDENGALRLICPHPTYASLLGVAFNQIRQNADGKPIVFIQLLEAIGRIAEHVQLDAQREALRVQLDAVTRAAERDVHEEFDLAAIVARADAARAVLGVSPAAEKD
ncbi:MAG TPA: DUF2254 domain-containing protein [Devosiaceae bacterium]|jgi:uncharacterized membrane protein|nr:DUF2254 domain-containing protein [Devosiaceae bacterium]